MPADALILVSFGGPEGPDDVLPFLRKVTAGPGIPDERLAEVGAHYDHFGGVSPINAQNRALVAAIEADFAANGVDLPLYWGNRNWHPMLADTVARMRDDGIEHALAFVTSAFGSYSGCRQYQDDIAAACATVGPGAPTIEKLRLYWNHPGFIEPMTQLVHEALEDDPDADLVFTAHSIPLSMTASSPYVEQLRAACAAIADGRPWDLVWQSRSGPPQVPWLEPDIGDHLRSMRAKGSDSVTVVPIGFVSDHMEVLWDLDTEARAIADEIGLAMTRVPTVGTHPTFVAMVRDLVLERRADASPLAVGGEPPWPDRCPTDCCPRPERPRSAAPG